MAYRVRSGESGPRSAVAPSRRLVAVVVLGGALGACGNGDDSTSLAPPPLASDAGAAGDATIAKPSEGGTADATRPTPDGQASGADGGVPVATFSPASVDVGSVPCSTSGTKTVTVTNTGAAVLTVSASAIGSAFAVSPTTLSVPAGGSGMLTITANVPGSSTAGTPIVGSLDIFTNDPARSNVPIALTATPTGATVVTDTGTTTATVSFPSSGLNVAAPGQTLHLKNIGNAAATVAFAAPTGPFSLVDPAAGASAQAITATGGTLTATYGFTPVDTKTASGTGAITVTGVTCGTGIASVSLGGQGAVGVVTGFPPDNGVVDFGAAECGGAMPTPKTITLTNSGTFDAHIVAATLTGIAGFSTSAHAGDTIPANGSLPIAFTAPPAPRTASAGTAVTATVSLQTDADPASTVHAFTLSEIPSGAVLAFDTAATANFGSFGSAVLLQSVSQPFNVVNSGNEAANVTLVLSGPGAGVDAGAGVQPTFSVSNPTFSLPASSGTQAESVTYGATALGLQTGSLKLKGNGVNGGVCATTLPEPIPLSGSGLGGGPSVAPTSLSFAAPCGGAAPPAQTFTVSNNGTADLAWTMSGVTGPGAAHYGVSAAPQPGVLHPGDSASVTVTPTAVASPAVDPNPSSYAASVMIATDVPFDDPHVVSLAETPVGDQLSLSTGSLRFGQFPINTTTLGQSFTITNNANAGSPAANFSLVASGPGAPGYATTPSTIANLAPGGAVSNPVSVTFTPTQAATYPATLGVVTSDSLCTGLPSPIGLVGTGTQAKVSVSATTLAFGTDTKDPAGLVNCGAAGLPHTFTVSNGGNQAFHVTGLALGLGAASPYVLSGPGAALPVTIPIHGSTTITVTPNAIPAAVANPDDPSPFTDTLTVTTDATLDAPHRIALAMQARGAVIADTPVAGTWTFGTVGGGSIGTFANTITNTGNAAVSVALSGMKQPSIFGLQNNPTMGAAGAVSAVIGQFSPPASNGQWSDTGTLVVTPAQAFCAPLPAAWTNVPVTMSGSSNGDTPIVVSGTLTFPSSDCGSAAPAARAVTLTNATNVAYSLSTGFSSGAFYTARLSGDGGVGTLPAKGSATIVVTPKTITPGPGVSAGSAPYVDDLVITVQTSPPTTFTVPIAWTLNGAVFALPQGLGPNRDGMGNPFYAADTASGLALPMVNTGTASATVSFAAQPQGAFSVSPSGPITVQPGITALPRLSSSASDATCPSLTSGSVTFLYSGPVCQPFSVSKVSIQSCAGTF